MQNSKRQIPGGKSKVDLDKREMGIIKISQVTKRKEIKCYSLTLTVEKLNEISDGGFKIS